MWRGPTLRSFRSMGQEMPRSLDDEGARGRRESGEHQQARRPRRVEGSRGNAGPKKEAPSIIFIDELDDRPLARGRLGRGRCHDKCEQTLNQVLTEMDGFTGNEGVIVLAAATGAESDLDRPHLDTLAGAL